MASGDGPFEMDNNEMPVPKIKHDWYQTETHVIITIMVKNVKSVKAVNGESTLSVTAELPSGSDYSLELDLAHHVVPDHCVYKIFSSKIEIKVKKRDGIRWNALEGNPKPQDVVQPIPHEILQADSQPPKYPTSSKKSRDWDKLEKEIEREESLVVPQGETAVNVLFQEIYGMGSDEVRRAMNKSFQESGGTVLSTNWSEVGKGKVERKPPHGMEWKSWNS
ncbi:hypothetical protein KM043_001421 [Ampulex compressa]|nr:hypothetical protein KM043_001421 [Ampulex compressa]